MKKTSFIILAAGLFSLLGCVKTEVGPTLRETITPPSITYPATGVNLVMTKPNASLKTAFSWAAADYGMPLGILYTIQVDKAGNNFASPVDVIAVNALTDTLTYAEFNSKMVALETLMETVNPIEVRIKTSVPKSDLVSVYSAPVSMNVTPYTAKDFIYVVGGYNGWNNTTALPMNRNMPGLKHELYFNLTAGNLEYKVLPTLGSWDGDIGDDPSNTGHLIPNGEQNMFVSAPGYYRLTVDLTTMTWSTLVTTWGIIGGFPGNSWASDFATMTYNAGTGVWTTTFTTSAAANFKFRANAAWTLNFGDTGADNKLEEGGADIALSTAGNYTVTLNLNATGNPQVYTYIIVKN